MPLQLAISTTCFIFSSGNSKLSNPVHNLQFYSRLVSLLYGYLAFSLNIFKGITKRLTEGCTPETIATEVVSFASSYWNQILPWIRLYNIPFVRQGGSQEGKRLLRVYYRRKRGTAGDNSRNSSVLV
jgi:hypothetical protein